MNEGNSKIIGQSSPHVHKKEGKQKQMKQFKAKSVFRNNMQSCSKKTEKEGV